MVKVVYFHLIFSAVYFQVTVSLECYNCTNISNVNTCATTTTCQIGQSCYLDFSNTAGYTLGCTENQKCGAIPHIPASLVGRNLNSQKQDYYPGNSVNDFDTEGNDREEREAQHCFECCSFDICNRILCAHLKPTACIDDPKVDCAWLNSKFNICQIIHEAKSVCPKFCALCSLVDGNWADWSPWGTCDVTCENGKQTRTRQCSNPVPANGGLNCSGNDIEHKPCILQNCPVDGNWGVWSSWSLCDVTCENGTQERTRICDNPSPAYHGHTCFGKSIEYKNCINDYCPVHGGWTPWLPWEACSVTCEIGIQRRHRNCSNPSPQHLGHYCFGDAMDVTMCLPGPCANGGWSNWNTWSACTVTCGAGIIYRSRTCTNPRPSALGLQCEGNSFQDNVCYNNNNTCLTATVAFQSKDLRSLNFDNSVYVFTNVTLNEGNGYNSSTGIFTAPISGLYSFSVQFCLPIHGSLVAFAIVHNRMDIKAVQMTSNGEHYACQNADALALMKVNDRVWVEGRSQMGSGFTSQFMWNTFSGYLIHG